MIKRLLIFISIITILGCSSGDIGQDQTMVDKITASDTIFTFDSLSKTGFKKNKTYNVENLPNADSAYFGWKKFGSEGPKDFEIRIYKSHEDAILHGTSFAEEGAGECGAENYSDE